MRIAADPLRPVVEVYEEVYVEVKDGVDGVDREEFIQLCPNLRSMYRSLYR